MPETIKPRNPVARSPLLRKGGVHERSRGAVRHSDRVNLSLNLADWEEDLAFEREIRGDVGSSTDRP